MYRSKACWPPTFYLDSQWNIAIELLDGNTVSKITISKVPRHALNNADELEAHNPICFIKLINRKRK